MFLKDLLVAFVAFQIVVLSHPALAANRLFPPKPHQVQLPKLIGEASDVRRIKPALDIRGTETKGYVLVFMGTQCPLVRAYLPRLASWSAAWAKQGIRTIAVFSHEHETAAEVITFANEKKIPFLTLKDEGAKIASVLRAQKTPEAFLLGDDYRVLYRGRIDDQFQFRATLPKANNEYLANAVASALAGKFPSPPVTDTEGCFINLGKPHAEITFNQDVGPIIYERCTRCHRENEVAGELFKFKSFETIVPHAETILGVVEDRVMPPWRGGLSGKFRNDFSMDGNDIWMIRSWAKSGAKMGEGAPPVAPPAPSKEGFRSGQPDAVLHMTPDNAEEAKKYFRIPPKSEEAVLSYMYFKVKTDFPEDKWLVAAEVKALAPEVVHHVTVFMVPPIAPEDEWILNSGFNSAVARRIAMKKYKVSADNFEWTFRLYGRGMRRPVKLIATFSPTEPTRSLPAGYGFLIPKGAELIFEAHYTPTEKEKLDRAAVGLWFGDMPAIPEHKQVITRMGAYMDEIQIPPKSLFSLDRKLKFFADAKLFSLRPHMHQRGKSFTGVLELPDGTKKRLLYVPHFDYNWQIEYQFEKPIDMPKGSILHAMYDWDNTERPGNPDATKLLTFGQQITDEMCVSYPTYVYANPNEQAEAEAELAQYLIDRP